MPSGVAWLTKKSRASGSASASQVSTLMPRSRALRSTRRDAAAVLDGDRDHVHPARDPVLDQLVLPARRRGSVGPSQISSTPSSRAASSAPARQLTKYGSPFAFGIMAIDRALWPTAARRRRPTAGRGAATERTSQTFVPATISEPARIARRARQPDCSSRQVSSTAACRVARAARRRARSMAIVDEQQRAGQHAGQLRRQRGQLQAVLQHRKREQPEQRAPQSCRVRRRPTCRRAPPR